MAAILKTGIVQENSSSVANLTLDSSGNVTAGNNLTVTGTSTLTGAITSSGLVTGATGALYPIVQGSVANLTSGVAAGFTNIPSWVKRITISISNLTSAATQTSVNIIQLGTGATPTYTNTGYLGNGGSFVATTSNSIAFTTGFAISATNAANFIKSGIATLTLVDSATNTWSFAFTGSGSTGSTANLVGSGYIALAGALTAVQLTTVNGTDTFATGKINILYE